MFTDIVLRDFSKPVKERHHKHCGPYHWTPSQPGRGRGFYQSSDRLACGDSTFSLRLELASEHISGRTSGISGYYCDEYGDGDTLQPIIALLPHGRGFLAGWTMGEGMCASLDSDIYQDATDAAYAAHSKADHDAENERMYQSLTEEEE